MYVVLVISQNNSPIGAELSSINFLLIGGYYTNYANIMGTMGFIILLCCLGW